MAKRFLKWAGISLVILALLVLLAPTLMPTGWIRERIEAESKAAGIPIAVEGLSLGWFSGATLEGLRIPNAEGFSEVPLLKIQRIHVDADLTALLSHKVHVRRVSVEGLEASLEQRAKDGFWNAMALQPKVSSSTPSAPSASGATPWPVALDSLTVEGKARLLAGGKALEIPELSLDASAPDLLAQPLKAALKLRAAAGDADWNIQADLEGSPTSKSGSLKATLKGKGLAGLLAPFLPLPGSLDAGEMGLEASLKDGRLQAALKNLSLKDLHLGPAVCALSEGTLAVEGRFPGTLTLEGDLHARGAGWGQARLSECRIAPKATLDLPSGAWTLASCPLTAGPLSGTLAGHGEGRILEVAETLKGDLAGLDKALTGVLPAGAAFTGLLDSHLALKGDAETFSVDGETSLSGFSVLAPGRPTGPRTDLKLSQKLGWETGTRHLTVSTLRLDTGTEGPLDLSLSGSVQDPQHLGELDLSGTLKADLARLQALLAGYFSDLPALDCRGRLEGSFRAQGARLATAVRLTDGRFSGGPFGAPIQIPQGALEADADLVRDDEGTRVLVRTFKTSMPFLSANLLEGLLELPSKGPGTVKAALDVQVSDLDATARFLSGPVPALRGYALAGRAAFHLQGSGPLAGPWVIPSVTASLSDFRASGDALPGPISLETATLEVLKAKASPQAFSAESMKLSSPLASLSCAPAFSGGNLDLTGLTVSADLEKAGALLAAWKLLPPGVTLSGALSAEAASLRVLPTSRSLALDKPLSLRAPGMGLERFELASLSLGDWASPLATFRSGPLEIDLDAAKAERLAGIVGKGPVTVRGQAGPKGKGVTLDFAVQATEAELALPSFRKPAATPLSLTLKGTMEDGVLACEKAELVFDAFRLGLEEGSRLPLDPSKDARLRLGRTVLALKDLAPYLPQLKGLSGSVAVEGVLDGPLAMPAALERLKADLAVTLDDVGLSYTGADGQPVPVQAKGSLHLTRESLALKDLVVSLRQEALSVSGEIRDPLQVPKGKITVTGGAFDLDRLLKLQPAAAGGGGDQAASATPSKPGPLFPPPLDQADLEVVFQLKELVYKGNKLAALDSRTTLQASHLRSENKATVNEGPVRIVVDLDASQKNPPLTAEVEAKDVRLDIELPKTARYFLPVLAGGKGITGKLTLEPLKVEGRGASWEALRDNVHTVQDGKLHVSSGEVQGAPFLAKLGEVLHRPGLGDLKFDTIDSVFRIREKRLENETTVKGKQGLILNHGWVDFDQTLEQKTTLSGDLLKTGDERWDKGLSLAMERGGILTDGTIDDPHPHLDMSAILKELAKDALQDLVKDRLKDLFK